MKINIINKRINKMNSQNTGFNKLTLVLWYQVFYC